MPAKTRTGQTAKSIHPGRKRPQLPLPATSVAAEGSALPSSSSALCADIPQMSVIPTFIPWFRPISRWVE